MKNTTNYQTKNSNEILESKTWGSSRSGFHGWKGTDSFTYSSIWTSTNIYETAVWKDSFLANADFDYNPENAQVIAKIRMAEFLRYSHEQFLIY